MIFKDTWHMYASYGPIENNKDLMRHLVVGTEHDLSKMAERKIKLGIWDCAWLFPPESNSGLDTVHPGNPYWVAELALPDYKAISWIHLDE